MAKTDSHASVRIVLHDGQPYIESRLRPVDDAADGSIPKGKILVVRTPLLRPGASEDETESELVDDDGSDEVFCPECAAAGHDPDEALRLMRSVIRTGDRQKRGRNDLCPCGSGRKYKRCCLN
jgi:hypothetical protein